jgi:ZIP family zinc transporter
MDTGLLSVIGLALLPALGNLGGGLLAEWLRPSHRITNLALHAATSIILTVISVEVMPQALQETSAWLLALAFLIGSGTHLFIEGGTSAGSKASQKEQGPGRG